MPKSSKTNKDKRRIIWEKADGVCAHCGQWTAGHMRTVDHFVPKSIGGTKDMRNLMPLCKKCNKARKSDNVDPMEFYMHASEDAIDACIEYKEEWLRQRTSLQGSVFAIQEDSEYDIGRALEVSEYQEY